MNFERVIRERGAAGLAEADRRPPLSACFVLCSRCGRTGHHPETERTRYSVWCRCKACGHIWRESPAV